MNEAEDSRCELKDLAETVEVLLEVGQYMGAEKAPTTPYDLFLRDGGFNLLEFIQFIAGVEKVFEIVLPFDYAEDWPNVVELARDMHSGRHQRWR